jgi:hypothetical protein
MDLGGEKMTPVNRTGGAAGSNSDWKGSPTTPSVAVVIPAYNEAERIGKVLEVLRQVKSLTEIIVVDDGSRDATAEVSREQARFDPRIRVLVHSENKGKGAAVFTGWRALQAGTMLMLDADLIGLKAEHVQALIDPVVRRRADMTLGLFRGGKWFTDFSHWLTPWLTGQRCFRSRSLRYVHPQAAAGYGLETALTIVARQRGWRCLRVPLEGVSHLPSEIHRGIGRGTLTRTRMYGQIVTAWYLASGWQRFLARIRQWAR